MLGLLTTTAAFLAAAATIARADQVVLTDIHSFTSWDDLAAHLGAALIPGEPFASSCFPGNSAFNTTACAEVKSRYLDEREHYPLRYISMSEG
jgi:hypothetical protein